METPEKPFSAPESLQLIQEMIQAAKRDLSDHSFSFLLWGWLVLVGALVHYGLLQAHFDRAEIAWPVFIALASIASFVNGRRRERRAQARTVQGEFLVYLWASFGVLMLMLVGVGSVHGWRTAYPLMIALYGLGTFTTGGTLHFRPLIWGGAACWLLAAVAFLVPFDTQLLLVAAAMLVAYVVPGHMLRNQYRRGRAL